MNPGWINRQYARVLRDVEQSPKWMRSMSDMNKPEPPPQEHVPAIGSRIWLAQKNGRGYPSNLVYQGQTSRSWLTGHSWKPKKWAKKEYRTISEQEAQRIIAECDWVSKHRWKIADEVRYKADLAALRQIAALVSYKEGE